MTDEATHYIGIGKLFARHGTKLWLAIIEGLILKTYVLSLSQSLGKSLEEARDFALKQLKKKQSTLTKRIQLRNIGSVGLLRRTRF